VSLVVRFRCPVCGATGELALGPEMLEEARQAGAARAVAACPRGHTVVLTLDAYGAVRSAVPALTAEPQECEVTDRAPPFLRGRLQALVEKGAAAEEDALLLEKAKEAGWIVC
jgi:hypothetical protein